MAKFDGQDVLNWTSQARDLVTPTHQRCNRIRETPQPFTWRSISRLRFSWRRDRDAGAQRRFQRV